MHRAFAAALVEKIIEAPMPNGIGPAADRERLLVRLRDEDETTETEQRRDTIFRLRFAPDFAKPIGERARLVGGVEAHDIQSLARRALRAHHRVHAVPDRRMRFL